MTSIKEHIMAGHYPRDDKHRSLVPTRGCGVATVLAIDFPGIRAIMSDGQVRKWRDDGEYWGPYDNARDDTYRAFDLLPPARRKVKVVRTLAIPTLPDGSVDRTRRERITDEPFRMDPRGWWRFVELIGEYEEP